MVLPYPCCLSPVSVTFRGSDVAKHEINSLFVVPINLALAYLLDCDYLLSFGFSSRCATIWLLRMPWVDGHRLTDTCLGSLKSLPLYRAPFRSHNTYHLRSERILILFYPIGDIRRFSQSRLVLYWQAVGWLLHLGKFPVREILDWPQLLGIGKFPALWLWEQWAFAWWRSGLFYRSISWYPVRLLFSGILCWRSVGYWTGFSVRHVRCALVWSRSSEHEMLIRGLVNYANLARHCQALSLMVGTLSIRLLPSFLGIGNKRSPWCFQLVAWVFNFCSSSNLSLKERASFPSIPAVFLPLFSWVTWRIARNLAATERIISFCSDRALAVSPSLTALYTLLCRRNNSWRNLFHGNLLQDSLLNLSMRLIILCSR